MYKRKFMCALIRVQQASQYDGLDEVLTHNQAQTISTLTTLKPEDEKDKTTQSQRESCRL
jgi:hypothetical protein